MEEFANYCGGAELSYGCLLQKERTELFIEAIRKKVKKDSIVLEAGTGTGILSIAATNAGARTVYAIEQNKLLIPQLRQNITNLGLADKIKIIEGDALKVKIPEKVDIIICEMICAGLIDEPQIPVLNHLLKYLKRGGSVIPKNAEITVQLAHDNYRYFGYKLPYLHFESPTRRAKALTNIKLFAKVNFEKINSPHLNNHLRFKTTRKGIVNAIRILTKTDLIEDISLGESVLGPTFAYCPTLVIPIEELRVEKGDTIELNLSYEMGGGMLTIKHNIL